MATTERNNDNTPRVATLQEKYQSIAKEYARQFAEIVGTTFEYWVGPVDGQCGIFGDMAFTMEQVMFVVDNIDTLTARYGSREAVGSEVCDWYGYMTDDGAPGTRRYVNLFSWLRGLSDAATREEALRDDGDKKKENPIIFNKNDKNVKDYGEEN